MKNVKLEFDGYWIDIEDGWLCMGDDENQVLLKPEYFKKLLEAINYTHCCETLKDVSKIVDKIVEENPLLCMPDDKQMQRDFLKEKWTNWFKKEYNL